MASPSAALLALVLLAGCSSPSHSPSVDEVPSTATQHSSSSTMSGPPQSPALEPERWQESFTMDIVPYTDATGPLRVGNNCVVLGSEKGFRTQSVLVTLDWAAQSPLASQFILHGGQTGGPYSNETPPSGSPLALAESVIDVGPEPDDFLFFAVRVPDGQVPLRQTVVMTLDVSFFGGAPINGTVSPCRF